MVTKLNVNIRTLLANCEELAKNEVNNWRLQKFIKSLDTMLLDLEEYGDPLSASKLEDYKERLQMLKTQTKYVDNTTALRRDGSSKHPAVGSEVLNEMYQLHNGLQFAEERKELINENSMRRRKPDDEGKTGDNMTEAVKYYNSKQEQIADHMLSLTRNLKEQTVSANRIIKKDTEVVNTSTGMTDNNINSLQKEATKLEGHSRNAWKCWTWMMIGFVIVVFIGMVLFMKIMKKRKS